MTLRQALGQRRFWMIGVGILAMITAQSGVTIHLIPLLTDRGLTAAQAAGVTALMGFSILLARVGVGALLDRFHAPKVARLVLALPAVATVVLALTGREPWALTAAALLLGLGAGAEIDLLSYFTSRYFGMRAYGRIYGVQFAMFSLGNGLGAPLIGTAFDHFHSYRPALWAATAVFGLGVGLLGFLGAYPTFDREETDGA